jgi:DNA polymerase I-like protein with 3'-5' exonuclease and polymerase domains/5'-3' exonuclease
MSEPTRLLLDMSSVMWKCLLVGKDKEFGHAAANVDPDKKDVWINSAEWGYENFITSVTASMTKFGCAPRDIVMVFDGENSKGFRRSIFPGYKEGREHHPDSYIEFDKLKQRVTDMLLGLGATAAWQDGYEADDVLGYLTQNLSGRKIVITNDGDLLVLHSPTTDIYRDNDLNVNKYGPFEFRHITLYKALVGDTGDKISGAKGFGPKSFIDLCVVFGEEGLDVMVDLVKQKQLGRLAEDVGELKSLQKIIDSADLVYQSYALAQLYTGRINRGRATMSVRAGMCQQWDPAKHDARLKQWYGTRTIVSAENYDSVVRRAVPHLLESDHIGFDIETSVPQEALDWLEAKARSAGDEERSNVDVLGSTLTGSGVTFGKNQQHTVYFTVDHVAQPGCTNLPSADVRKFMELIPASKRIVVQNASFELTVLYQDWGAAWANNGFEGFLANIDDTKLMKSYVDENTSSGLKWMSENILGYKQTSYAEVTQGRQMNELTAAEVFNYGTDDPICTTAAYTYLRFMMELEHTWDVYREVEIGACYLNAQRYLAGTEISIEKMNELAKIDDEDYDKSWAYLRNYLISKGWEGTRPPVFNDELSAAEIKAAYEIVTGTPLQTQVRTGSKLVALIEAAGHSLLAGLVDSALKKEPGALDTFEGYVKNHFKGEPELNFGSTTQMRKLLYETLGLPVRLRNKPTDAMRAAGIREGGERTDHLAIEFALTYDTDLAPEVREVLKSLQTIKTVTTRRALYYKPYQFVKHWKDNLVHAQINQCATVTRRASSSGPNLQQLPKHPKQGKLSRFREVFVPHKKDAVVVSIDFDGQELRSITEQSQDENMLACYMGAKKKDMHVLTGVGIINAKSPTSLWRMLGREIDAGPEFVEAAQRWSQYTYDLFSANRANEEDPDYDLLNMIRNLAKKTNFTTEYGAMAPKLAETLIIPTEEAQQYINAKLAAFPRADEWKREVMEEARILGYTTTMMGARRHLSNMIFSSNKFDVTRAERQGVNYKVQGSCAEQTKLAEGRLWQTRVFSRYDAKYIGPIHDELVSSVVASQCVAFIKEKHAAMVAPYGGMKVPIVGSISLGPNFGQQIEIGDQPDEAKIIKALQSLGHDVNMTTA